MSDSSTSSYELLSISPSTGIRFFIDKDPGSYFPSHWHDAIEIIYLLEGNLELTIENHLYHLSAGHCALINSCMIHSTKCISGNTGIVLQIPADFFRIYVPDFDQLHFVLNDPSDNPHQQTKLRIFKDTPQQMYLVDDIRPAGYLLRFNSLLFEILYQLYHNFAVHSFQTGDKHRQKDLNRLSDVIRYTNANYMRPISISEIAQVTFLEPKYFCRFFKKNMGITFLQFQNEIRLSHIYQDLILTDTPLNQILEQHGFTNEHLFRRVFFEHFQTTPSQIRKK